MNTTTKKELKKYLHKTQIFHTKDSNGKNSPINMAIPLVLLPLKKTKEEEEEEEEEQTTKER